MLKQSIKMYIPTKVVHRWMGATQDSLRYTVTTTRRGAHFAHCVDDKGRWSLQARIPINTTERHKRCHEERMMSPEHCFHSYTSHLHFIVIHWLSVTQYFTYELHSFL
ncbi:hypothetical protein J6590_053881 [Homalodisca vitripennis]|nr:hypothetical protein J6590_053881 [Homalodisca vitripennis]